MSVVADFRMLWRFPGFRKLLTVRLLSQFTDGVFQVGLAAYVVFSPEQQTSPEEIAAAMAVLLLPYSLLGPFAGALLDRWRRRQVLLYGNLLRAGLASATCLLVLASASRWQFYLSALSVTAINRFILAGLSAALPRVVDRERLVIANSLSPTAGTVAATVGGAAAFGLSYLTRSEASGDATALMTAAVLYLLAGLAALRMGRDLLGPDPSDISRETLNALAATARGLLAGLRHLHGHRTAARVLLAVATMRFCYGALLVTVLMLARYAWGADTLDGDGMALLGIAVGLSGAGFFTAAVVTPWAVARLGRLGWFAWCAASAAVLVPALGLSFRPLPVLIAAFVLGLVTQGSKIVTDTVVQSAIDDAYRGRVFSIYDMLFNVAFVGAAGLAALMLPPDGRSATLVLTTSVIYTATALAMVRFHRISPDVSVT
ncbi:MFS transporter [Streptomyces aidingensis]|uniref:MFS-type transporter involved in bile tolerance, Atg22 family n=1 Tax=Streptomyces aidingensis TaxID=910347 RepID=A0A1I1QJ61_9ACTN|nr:MFS transporter [Streptomyces aidingensis]SFD22047.1 MFS-type transporter involved in bile tolerance, Atg22 family [Streptomyces aidingensis]